MRRGMSHAGLEGSRRVQQGRPEESGSAALATIALHYGLPLSVRDIRQTLGIELHNDMFHLLFACRRCGFDVVPLEGDFEHLPEVSRPNMVQFRRTENQGVDYMVLYEGVDYMVLYEIDQDSVVIGNTATGAVQRLVRKTSAPGGTAMPYRFFPIKVSSMRFTSSLENGTTRGQLFAARRESRRSTP